MNIIFAILLIATIVLFVAKTGVKNYCKSDRDTQLVIRYNEKVPSSQNRATTPMIIYGVLSALFVLAAFATVIIAILHIFVF